MLSLGVISSGYLEVLLFAGDTVRTFPTAHLCQLMIIAQVEALRSSLSELEELLEKYFLLMNGLLEKSVDRAIKYGAILVEVSSQVTSESEPKGDPQLLLWPSSASSAASPVRVEKADSLPRCWGFLFRRLREDARAATPGCWDSYISE